MELYKTVSYDLSRRLTEAYSTSFSMSSRLFARSIRPDIYAIYGLVRVADEIVDTYDGSDDEKHALLDTLEQETYLAIERQYSANPIVHAFALTVASSRIDRVLIAPFFASMRMDIGRQYSSENYQEYIYGSAEVVGLMCLKVFCRGDDEQYEQLVPGARKLGSAYQKVNFLRDFAADYTQLERVYFPGVEFDSFSNEQKRAIEQEIESEFAVANEYIGKLPVTARRAVRASWVYYRELLKSIQKTSVKDLRSSRVRVNNARKLWLLIKVYLGLTR